MKKVISRFIEERIVKDTRRVVGREVRSFQGIVLDLGCGESGSFDYNREVVSVDKYKERLYKLESQGKKIVVDAEKRLPFKNNEFEIVVFSGVIQYLKNYEKSIREINRVLKPKGKLILATVNKRSLLRRFGLIKKTAKIEGGEKNIFSEEELIRILKESDFKIERILGADFLKIPKNLSSNLVFIARK